MITDKLLKFKALNITVEKDASNPFFKSRYTTLNEVLSKVQKPLADMKVLVLQEPAKEGLVTRLVDTEDASEVSSTVPYMGVTDMQKLGGAITYARRYALIAMLGLEDEDDDGTLASKPILGGKSVQTAVGDPLKDDNYTI